MSVLVQTSFGELVFDLFYEEAPRTCLNFLKLCQIKYYNNCIFHLVEKDFVVQTGDSEYGTGKGGSSIFGIISNGLNSNTNNYQSYYLQNEIHPKLKHDRIGVVSMCGYNNDKNKIASQFFITTSNDRSLLQRLDKTATVFAEITEGFDILMKINETFVDAKYHKPLINIRINHTFIIDDPFDNELHDNQQSEEEYQSSVLFFNLHSIHNIFICVKFEMLENCNSWKSFILLNKKIMIELHEQSLIPEESPEPKFDKHDIERLNDIDLQSDVSDIEVNDAHETDEDEDEMQEKKRVKDEKLKQKKQKKLQEEVERINHKTDTQLLVMLDDIKDVDTKAPENVLFLCNLSPFTTSDELAIIFSRFGSIVSCNVVRDWKTDHSLQYAFIAYADVTSAEMAYVKMNNVSIDDRRIKVDFSQSTKYMEKYQKYLEQKNRYLSGNGKNGGFENRRKKNVLQFEKIEEAENELGSKYNRSYKIDIVDNGKMEKRNYNRQRRGIDDDREERKRRRNDHRHRERSKGDKHRQRVKLDHKNENRKYSRSRSR